jgi:hypothetical protein
VFPGDRCGSLFNRSLRFGVKIEKVDFLSHQSVSFLFAGFFQRPVVGTTTNTEGLTQ